VLSIIKSFFYRILCGFVLGVSVFAPGFSGSLIAIIMGIYQDLLRIASNPFKDLKKNIKFCLPLGIGVVISAVLFVISFKFLFEKYEMATYLLFVGLISGNLPVIVQEVKKAGFKKHYLIGGAAAFAASLTLGLLATGSKNAHVAAGFNASLPMLAFSGLAAGVTAPVPGMSVSMVLIITGVYEQLIFAAESLLHFDFTYLFQVGIIGVCAVAGIVIASRVIKVVFERFQGFANTTVFGFMAGFLVSIIVESIQIKDTNFNLLTGVLMLAIGLFVSMLFVVLGRNMKSEGIN
jgi:putative membrane protein